MGVLSLSIENRKSARHSRDKNDSGFWMEMGILFLLVKYSNEKKVSSILEQKHNLSGGQFLIAANPAPIPRHVDGADRPDAGYAISCWVYLVTLYVGEH